MTPIRPARLHAGARIGVVCPAYWLEPERLQRATGVFENLGYQIVLGKTCQLKDNIYAGSPEARAADVMAMFSDSSIDMILCARGGYGGNRVLPLLDYDVIRQNPKIFVGYSDVTGPLNSIAQRTGLVTFHGPMLTTFGEETVQFNLDALQNLLSGKSNVRIDSPSGCKARTLRAGSTNGPAWGGNLILLSNRLGTPDQIDTRGAILFIEEVGEKRYAFDRLLVHLKDSGSLDCINGLVVGELVDMSDTDVVFGKTTDEIILDVCGEFDFPIVSNFPCGHGMYQATLPVSHNIELHAMDDAPFILVPEPPVM
jgi:muramoyltetrapeptide carboxypeptidase